MAPGVVPGALKDLPQDDGSPALLENDLILAAELGQALLERNEELNAQLEQKEKEIEVKCKVNEVDIVLFCSEIFWFIHLLGLTKSF